MLECLTYPAKANRKKRNSMPIMRVWNKNTEQNQTRLKSENERCYITSVQGKRDTIYMKTTYYTALSVQLAEG